MTTEDEKEKAIATLGIGPAAKELYVDLLGPTAKELGKNLHAAAKLVTFAFAPVHAAVQGLESVQEWLGRSLAKRLQTADPDDIQAPPSYIAGQLLLQLPFCMEQEELREMYARLLASAMKRSTANKVHPAFISIIQQLTPDEALLLRRVADGDVELSLKETESESAVKQGCSVEEQFMELCKAVGLNTSMSLAYLENLLRLKVLSEEKSFDSELHPEGGNDYGDWAAHLENISVRRVQLSEFGWLFLEVCVSERAP